MAGFNTFNFSTPLGCSFCGTKHVYIQTKEFGDDYITYQVGDMIKRSEYNTSNYIVKEDVICDNIYVNCCKIVDNLFGDSSYMNRFFIVVKQGKYIGTVPSLEQAEYLLNKGESTDLQYELMIG